MNINTNRIILTAISSTLLTSCADINAVIIGKTNHPTENLALSKELNARYSSNHEEFSKKYGEPAKLNNPNRLIWTYSTYQNTYLPSLNSGGSTLIPLASKHQQNVFCEIEYQPPNIWTARESNGGCSLYFK